jgi:hypothetical protein
MLAPWAFAAAHEQGVGPSKGSKGPLDIINLMTELASPALQQDPAEGDAAPHFRLPDTGATPTFAKGVRRGVRGRSGSDEKNTVSLAEHQLRIFW